MQAGGLVVYKLKKRWRDGSTHVVMDAMTLLERLRALVSPPRKKLLTYHGVFAPAASCRQQVVPAVGAEGEGCRHRSRVEVRAAEEQGGGAAKAGQKVPHAPRKVRIPRSKYTWAELLRRVCLVEVFDVSLVLRPTAVVGGGVRGRVDSADPRAPGLAERSAGGGTGKITAAGGVPW